MTKEELKQESEEYFKNICEDYNEEYERTGKRHYWVGYDVKNAYLAGAEPREKRIAEELKAEWRLNDLYQKVLTDFANAEKCSREYLSRYITAKGLMQNLLNVVVTEVTLNPLYLKLTQEAEQFLKGVEND